MSDMADLPVHDDSETVLEDVYCVECAYNLRTLRRDGACPECQTPVTESLGTPEHRGIQLLSRAILAGLGAVVFAGVSPFFIALAAEPRSLGFSVAVLFCAVCAGPSIVVFKKSYVARRLCRKRLFGPAGYLAIVISALASVLAVGVLGFIAYECRDTTVYAARWDKEAYLSIQRGMTRAQVDSLIGKPLGRIPVEKLVRGRWAEAKMHAEHETWEGTRADYYSRRMGFCGWRHWVVYDDNDLVTDTTWYWYAD